MFPRLADTQRVLAFFYDPRIGLGSSWKPPQIARSFGEAYADLKSGVGDIELFSATPAKSSGQFCEISSIFCWSPDYRQGSRPSESPRQWRVSLSLRLGRDSAAVAEKVHCHEQSYPENPKQNQVGMESVSQYVQETARQQSLLWRAEPHTSALSWRCMPPTKYSSYARNAASLPHAGDD